MNLGGNLATVPNEQVQGTVYSVVAARWDDIQVYRMADIFVWIWIGFEQWLHIWFLSNTYNFWKFPMKSSSESGKLNVGLDIYIYLHVYCPGSQSSAFSADTWEQLDPASSVPNDVVSLGGINSLHGFPFNWNRTLLGSELAVSGQLDAEVCSWTYP